MTYYDNLYTYNGDTKHDMLMDFDNFENSDSSDVFDESDINTIIETLNDWD